MSKIVNNLLTELDMTKTELRIFVTDLIDSEMRKASRSGDLTNEEKVKSIIKDLLKKHYKTLWTKTAYVLDDL